MINIPRLEQLLDDHGFVDGHVECLIWNCDGSVSFVWVDDPSGLYQVVDVYINVEVVDDFNTLTAAINFMFGRRMIK